MVTLRRGQHLPIRTSLVKGDYLIQIALCLGDHLGDPSEPGIIGGKVLEYRVPA